MKKEKKILVLLGSFFAAELIYQGLLYMERMLFPRTPFMIALLSLVLGIFVIVYIIINRGFPDSSKSNSPTPDGREREDGIREQRKKKTEFMLYVIIALSMVLAIDLVTLFLF